jgi:trans-4-hydroxy-L-proline dehydratase
MSTSPVIQKNQLDDRTLTLRTRCLERKLLAIPWDGDLRLVIKSLKNSAGISSWTLRRGLLTRDLLSGLPFEIDDLELLAGRPAVDRAEWQAERQEARQYLAEHYPPIYSPGQSGHCQLDLSRLFELGMDGLVLELKTRRIIAEGHTAEVYQSFLDALEGLGKMIENAAESADEAARRSNPERSVELDKMAALCRRVAHLPPATFREALQLTWLVILGVQWADRAALVVPGHLDRILGNYYEADMAASRLTLEEALVLIESLYILINEAVPDGLAVSVMVGGRDAHGNDLTNPLSYLCLEALRRTRLVYPTVGVCWHAGTPRALIDLAVDLIAGGNPNPAFFNDETIQRGLMSYGVPPEESWNYINSTCVEITPVGASNVWVASPYYSLNRILIDELRFQVERGTPAASYAEFIERYRQRLAGEIENGVQVENSNRQVRQQHGGKPLQSVFTRDCIARGRDIDDGGARYNWAECSFVGLANLADGLYVLNQEVYVQERLELSALLEILDADFNGFESTHQRFMNAYPKYGNDHPEVDQIVGGMVAFIQQECRKHRMVPDDSPYVPGAFCWVMHEMLGRECGATPDGRRAGFPFADGCGGAQGREQTGPTAAVLSVTNWDAAPLIGGAAFNMKFGASMFRTPESRERLRDLIVTFLLRGGFETQVNVVDAGVLRQAQAHPDEYRDLVVRIGGYTDYFTRLTPKMQAEVIARTEYEHI